VTCRSWRSLGLGWRTVDLVGQDDVGEHGAAHEAELPVTGGLVLLHDLRAGDVGGHEIGGELDAAEAEVHDLGQGADQQGLGQARHTLQQHVASGEQRDEHLLDDTVLPHDAVGDLAAHGLVGVLELVDAGGVDHRRSPWLNVRPVDAGSDGGNLL